MRANVASTSALALSSTWKKLSAEYLSWSREEVDQRLQEIMRNIHAQCVKYGTDKTGYVDCVNGVNIGGFVKVAEAMLAYGVM